MSEDKKLTEVLSLRETVAQRIKEVGPDVEQKVVDILVDRVLKERVNLITKGFDKLSQAERDLKKIKPDNVTYNEDGSVRDEGYSKSKVEERKKAKQRIEALRGALEKALSTQPNFDKLKKLAE
jgi:hypothetical protein